jgi:hypothetical protein
MSIFSTIAKGFNKVKDALGGAHNTHDAAAVAAAIAANKAKAAKDAEAAKRKIAMGTVRLQSSGQSVPVQNKDAKLGLSGLGHELNKGLEALQKPGDAVRVGLRAVRDDLHGGNVNVADALKKGWTGEQKYSGADMMKDMGVKSQKGQVIGGIAAEILTDPINLIGGTGVGSLVKGAATGRRATLAEETLSKYEKYEKAKKITKATEELQKIHGVTSKRDLAKSLDVPYATIDENIYAHSLGLDAKSVGTTEHAAKVSEHAAQSRAAAQASADAHAGAGIKIAGKQLVSGKKMQDIGANARISLGGAHNSDTALSKAGNLAGDAFSNSHVAGLTPQEETLFKKFNNTQQGMQNLADHTSSKVFRNIAALQRGTLVRGHDVDKVMDRLIVKKGAGLTTEEWDTVITDTPRKVKAAEELAQQFPDIVKDPANMTLLDLKNIYTSSLKGVGMHEKSLGILHNVEDQFVKGIDKTGKDAPTYFPRVINHEINSQMRKGGMTRNLNIQNTFNTARNAEYKNLTAEEINAKIRDKLNSSGKTVPDDYKFLEESALASFMTRQLSSNKMVADRTTINEALGTFGKRIKSASDAKQAMYEGYDIVVPVAKVKMFSVDGLEKGIKQYTDNLPGSVGTTQMPEGFSAGFTDLTGTKEASALQKLLENHGDALTKISEQDAKNLVGSADLEMYALPKGMADKYNRTSKVQLTNGASAMVNVVNKFYGAWKPLVTGMNVKYHLRNIASGTFNNFLNLGTAIADPTTQRAAVMVAAHGGGSAGKSLINISGKEYTAKEIYEEMVQNNALGTFMLTDSNTLKHGTAEDMLRRNSGGLGERLVSHPAATVSAGSRAVGNRAEEYIRAVNYIANRKAGLSPEVAAEMVQKYQFDYQDISEFEKNIKLVLPFYTWARKNIPLQVESILNDPRPYVALSRATKVGSEVTGTNYEDVPDYERRNFAVPYENTADGRTKMLDFGAPAGDLYFNGADAASMLNPMIKIPIEVGTGYNFLTGGSLYSQDGSATAMTDLASPSTATGRLIANNPYLQNILAKNPKAATAIDRVAGSTGALNDLNKYLAPADRVPGSVQGSRDANTTPGVRGAVQRMTTSNMVKYLDPQQAATNRDRDYASQLAALIGNKKKMGAVIKTINQATGSNNGDWYDTYQINPDYYNQQK